MSRLKPGLAFALLLACLALGLVACGGGDSSTTSTTAADEATTDTSTTSTTTSSTSGTDSSPGSGKIAAAIGSSGFDPEKVYEEAAPSVVTISSIFPASGAGSILGGGGAQAGQGSGSVISDDGEILTNAHVVTNGEAGGGADLKEAKEVYVQFADHNQVQAKIVGFDPYADIALIKVDPKGLDLHPIELGDDRDLKVGEPVATLGSPFGQEQSLSVGVISATDRSIQSLTQFTINGAIQTDASINPGNSGGPMLDGNGRQLGLNQQIETTSGGNQGVGFAVPIDLAKRSLDQLRAKGHVDYAFIGVTTEALYPQLADKLGVDADTGALVVDVTNGGPADKAGIRGSDSSIQFQGRKVDVGGDIIVALNGNPVVSEDDLPRAISRLNPGDKVTLTVIRDGEKKDIDVTLAPRPPDAAK